MYTDYLGNPVQVGDLVAYPMCTGSAAADTNLAVIEEIVPIHPLDPSDPNCRRGYTKADLLKCDCGDYVLPRTFKTHDKAYTVKVTRRRSGAYDHPIAGNLRVTLKNVDRMIVVSSLVKND